MMNKISPVLNVVLLVAVGVLYILHFTGPKNKSAAGTNNDTVNVAMAAEGGIAFINIDSVMANYKMYEDVVGDLQDKYNTSDAQLQSKQRAFQKNYEDAQYKVQRGLVTRSEAEELQNKLAEEEQKLRELQNKLQYQLAEEQQVAHNKVLNSIMEYLKSMDGAEKYQYVLGNSFGGNILYANNSFNITNQVIKGLNEAYEKNQNKE